MRLSGDNLLSIEGVSVTFAVKRARHSRLSQPAHKRVVALDDVSLRLEPGQTLGVVGESGSGKSTLARVIAGLITPDSGSVQLAGASLVGRARDRESARRIQMVFQDPYGSLNPQMSVGRAISEAAAVHGLLGGRSRSKVAEALLERVGLAAGLAPRRPSALSGGQRQRVAIARALAAQPKLLLADEATSALDVSVQSQILTLLRRLRDEDHLAMVFISHQLAVVASIADRIAIMYLGRIVETGRTDEVFSSPSHPYTQALLAAQPGRHRHRIGREAALTGEIPSALELPSGCRFRTRCPLAQDVCATTPPASVTLSATHSAECHFITATAEPNGAG